MGVPQGTILGSLLFILYVNDLLESMSEDSILPFADDTAIISAEDTWVETHNKMNNQLGIISDCQA